MKFGVWLEYDTVIWDKILDRDNFSNLEEKNKNFNYICFVCVGMCQIFKLKLDRGGMN